ncbi:hypothetical protein EDB73_101370 [Vibrio crassostreae]|nr:hypothetical protein EDB73_101370 [Vibrio crassostreae]
MSTERVYDFIVTCQQSCKNKYELVQLKYVTYTLHLHSHATNPQP